MNACVDITLSAEVVLTCDRRVFFEDERGETRQGTENERLDAVRNLSRREFAGGGGDGRLERHLRRGAETRRGRASFTASTSSVMGIVPG
jgi:hypothetical protein